VVQSASLDAPSQVASADNSFVPAPNGPGVSGWGRFDETRVNIDPTGSSFGNYKLRVQAPQFGIDDSWHNANNTVIVGGYVAPFHSYADFTKFGDAHINAAGTAYALYGLWFSGPWQAGLRLNYDNNSARFYDTYLGTNAVVHPNEKGIQAAASYMMPFDGWNLQPSAELNYGTIEGSKFVDGVGDNVLVGSTNDFWGKLNARFSTDVTTERGLLVQPYANIGLLYRGDTTTDVHVGTFGTASNVNGINGDFAVGVNTNLAANLSLSAQADYLAGNRINGWTGFLGLRYTP
jgi:outer membrane autotransporter protein